MYQESISVPYVVFLDYSQCFQVHLLQDILPLRCPIICPGEGSTIPMKLSPYNTPQQQLIQGHLPRKIIFYITSGFLKHILIAFFLKRSLSKKVYPMTFSASLRRKKEMSDLSDESFGFRSRWCVHLHVEIPALISPYTRRSLAARDPHRAGWSALGHSQDSPLVLASGFSFNTNVLDGWTYRSVTALFQSTVILINTELLDSSVLSTHTHTNV